MEFDAWIEVIGQGIDVIGVAIVVVGSIGALAPYVWHLVVHRDASARYREVRRRLGRAILLGLEFLVAGDIIRTVAAAPTLAGVTVLAIIVGIRTFLSMALEVEIEGHPPWRRTSLERAEGS